MGFPTPGGFSGGEHPAGGSDGGSGFATRQLAARHLIIQALRIRIASLQLEVSPETQDRMVEIAILNFVDSPYGENLEGILASGRYGEPAYLECRKFLSDLAANAVHVVVKEESLAARLGVIAARVRRLDPMMLRALVLRSSEKFGYEQIAFELGLGGPKEARDLFYRAMAELHGPPPAGCAE